MANNKPLSYVEMAAFAVSIAHNWKTNYPTYSTGFLTANDLEQMALALKAKSLENSQQIDSKKSNSTALKVVNKTINKAINSLKRSIQYQFDESTDFSSHYQDYCLEKTGKKGAYSFPADNDKRAEVLVKLVAKLQDSNNPLREDKFGAAFWEPLQAQHELAWVNSKNMRATKSRLSMESLAYFKNIRQALNKLGQQIRIDFSDGDVSKVLRVFGFINEDFNRAAASHTRKQKKAAKKSQQSQPGQASKS